jgi:inorganic triphosphatase YgiF
VSTEVELKLAMPVATLRQAERLPWLRKLAAAPVSPARLVSDYLDTRKLTLRKHGVTLRLRKVGSKRVQTIKGQNGAGALGRSEREDEISSNQPRLKYAKGTPLAPLVTKKLEKKLRRVFRTDVRRRVMNLQLNGSDIELAFDHGKVVAAGARSEPIHELELELKKGRAADLAALARRLRNNVPIAFEARSKSDRGYALVNGARDGAVHASPIALKRDQAAGPAFAEIGPRGVTLPMFGSPRYLQLRRTFWSIAPGKSSRRRNG